MAHFCRNPRNAKRFPHFFFQLNMSSLSPFLIFDWIFCPLQKILRPKILTKKCEHTCNFKKKTENGSHQVKALALTVKLRVRQTLSSFCLQQVNTGLSSISWAFAAYTVQILRVQRMQRVQCRKKQTGLEVYVIHQKKNTSLL